MREHHQVAVNNLIAHIKDQNEFLAIIVSGSIAKGTARENSDIDVYLVVTEDAFHERKQDNDLFYFNNELCDYPDGYIDGKIINMRFLEQAVLRGSEPTRASFAGSMVVYSRLPGLEALIKQIPVYPEHNRIRNITDFYAQVRLYGNYFANQALQHDNVYLASHSISSLVLFASRLILAHNRILFPCHKSLMTAVEKATDKPQHFIESANEILRAPTIEKVKAFVEQISSFQHWGITDSQAVSIFVENNEWNWLEQEPPLQDR
ncbi:nucleotidyltransferase domain-containing protein [Paenibacillus sp. HB172176]|uniref:nucleotidyltransferase domain-containing protein n=1 Tax=Paenibacillus sp. HB172176 TaxID=2493690 RepID=UPI00143C4959|nr:nucleotidyltransferase domain-containing protein [Paenibacillus sp. HB172176]